MAFLRSSAGSRVSSMPRVATFGTAVRPGPLSGLERQDDVVRDVRLVDRLRPLLHVAADLRRQVPPEPRGDWVLVLEADLPAARVPTNGCLCCRPPDTCAALRTHNEELVESVAVVGEAVDEREPYGPVGP